MQVVEEYWFLTCFSLPLTQRRVLNYIVIIFHWLSEEEVLNSVTSFSLSLSHSKKRNTDFYPTFLFLSLKEKEPWVLSHFHFFFHSNSTRYRRWWSRSVRVDSGFWRVQARCFPVGCQADVMTFYVPRVSVTQIISTPSRGEWIFKSVLVVQAGKCNVNVLKFVTHHPVETSSSPLIFLPSLRFEGYAVSVLMTSAWRLVSVVASGRQRKSLKK